MRAGTASQIHTHGLDGEVIECMDGACVTTNRDWWNQYDDFFHADGPEVTPTRASDNMCVPP